MKNEISDRQKPFMQLTAEQIAANASRRVDCPSARVPTAPRVTAHTVRLPDLVIVEDTREQRPLTAEFAAVAASGDAPKFSVERGTLHTGDYSVRGLEMCICFERKSVEDLVQTLNPKAGNYEPDWGKPWLRFNRELMRMSFYDRRFILCEGSLCDIVSHRYQSQIDPRSVRGMLKSIEREHGVRTVFCGSRVSMARFIIEEGEAYFRLRFKKYFRAEDMEKKIYE